MWLIRQPLGGASCAPVPGSALARAVKHPGIMLFDTATDDEITVIQVRDELEEAFEPPALPFPLVARKGSHEMRTDELEFVAAGPALFG